MKIYYQVKYLEMTVGSQIILELYELWTKGTCNYSLAVYVAESSVPVNRLSLPLFLHVPFSFQLTT